MLHFAYPLLPEALCILSCVVYGVAFDFFNVSGGIFVDQECAPDIKASAQGLFMMMTNGLGATIGTLTAGEIVNKFCSWQDFVVNGEKQSFLVGEWQTCWFVFAASPSLWFSNQRRNQLVRLNIKIVLLRKIKH